MHGIKFLLSVIAVLLVYMLEKGTPVKPSKGDFIAYGMLLIFITTYVEFID